MDSESYSEYNGTSFSIIVQTYAKSIFTKVYKRLQKWRVWSSRDGRITKNVVDPSHNASEEGLCKFWWCLGPAS